MAPRRKTHLRFIQMKGFTAFEELKLTFSPGLNVLLGGNATGKTHILKALYAAAAISRDREEPFEKKLLSVFLPSGNSAGRLAHRPEGAGVKTGFLKIERENDSSVSLKVNTKTGFNEVLVPNSWHDQSFRAVYIPVKEILAHAPGFLALYKDRAIHFESTYPDLITQALLPPKLGQPSADRQKVMAILENAISGHVSVYNEEFFVNNLEFPLVSEGQRKLALLWKLTQNGVLTNGSILFWDEPEANLNPSLMPVLADLAHALTDMGVQIFLATHHFLVAKWLELKQSPKQTTLYHYFSRVKNQITVETKPTFSGFGDELIQKSYEDLFDFELRKNLSRE